MFDSRPTDPAAAFAILTEGNRRFVEGRPEHPSQDAARRAALTETQRPFAVLFGCSDSRLAAEIIFDRGLGDLFVVRTAGHVMGNEVTGSIEYGVGILDCPLVVVLGHDSCGAVAAARAAVDGEPAAPGFIADMVDKVTPSILAARAEGIDDADSQVDVHISRTVDLLLERSRIVSDAVAAGRTAVVGLSYRLTDGAARFVRAAGLPSPAEI